MTAVSSRTEELVHIIFDGNFNSVHKDLRDVLFDPAFDPHANLTLNQAGRVS